MGLLVLVAALGGAPAAADTKGKLEAAREALAAAKAELADAAAEWQAAEAAYAQTHDAFLATRRAVARLRARLAAVEARLAARAREAYMAGAGATMELLLSSGSFAEFTDRLEFVGSIAESDLDLITEAEVRREELRRREEELARLADRRRAEAARLEAAKARAAAQVARLQDVVADLERRLRAEQASILLGAPPQLAGAIQVCPVAGPNSFVDSFGAPRSGGRTHQGIDLLAPFGTPVVAVRSGNAVRSYNALGGISVIVYHANGDFTYYAHLSSYGATGQVSTGTVIGYVGSTGNAGSVNHLHFEYHPGGGAAVNPYAMLRAVCG